MSVDCHCLGYEARGAGSGARDRVDHDQVAAEKLKVTNQYILGPDIMDLKCDAPLLKCYAFTTIGKVLW